MGCSCCGRKYTPAAPPPAASKATTSLPKVVLPAQPTAVQPGYYNITSPTIGGVPGFPEGTKK